MDKKVFTPRIKLNRANWDSTWGKFIDTATFPDGETVQFDFTPENFTTQFGDECIGKAGIPGKQRPVNIKIKVNKDGKTYHSGCIDYEKSRYININIVPTQDSVPEYTISFTKLVKVEDSSAPF